MIIKSMLGFCGVDVSVSETFDELTGLRVSDRTHEVLILAHTDGEIRVDFGDTTIETKIISFADLRAFVAQREGQAEVISHQPLTATDLEVLDAYFDAKRDNRG